MNSLNITMVVVLATTITVVGCGKQNVVEVNKLLDQGGLCYEINSKTPFTGVAVQYWPSGQKEAEHEYRDGKEHGKITIWYENGQMELENEYRDGKLHGKSNGWYANGQKEAELSFRDGKMHGKATVWYENGQKQCEVKWRDGVAISSKKWNRDGISSK